MNKLKSSFLLLEIRIDWHLYRKIRNPEEDAKLIDLCAIFGNRSRLHGEEKGDSFSISLLFTSDLNIVQKAFAFFKALT